jgi:hypothetical protein
MSLHIFIAFFLNIKICCAVLFHITYFTVFLDTFSYFIRLIHTIIYFTVLLNIISSYILIKTFGFLALPFDIGCFLNPVCGEVTVHDNKLCSETAHKQDPSEIIHKTHAE